VVQDRDRWRDAVLENACACVSVCACIFRTPPPHFGFKLLLFKKRNINSLPYKNSLLVSSL
jgi:hypothetical protein